MKKLIIIIAILGVLGVSCTKKGAEPGGESGSKEQVEITDSKTVSGTIRMVGSEPLPEIIYTVDNMDYHFTEAILSELKSNGYLNYDLKSITAKVEIKKIFTADGRYIGEKRTFIDFILPKPVINEKCVVVSDPNSSSYNSPITANWTQTISKTTPEDYTILPFQNSPYRCGTIKPNPEITIKGQLNIGYEYFGVCYKINPDGSQSPIGCPGIAVDWKIFYNDKAYKVSEGTLFLSDSIDRKSLIDYGVYEFQGYFKGELFVAGKATFIENGVKPVDFIPKTGLTPKTIRGILNDAKTTITDLDGNQTNLTTWGDKPFDMVDYSLINSGSEYIFTVTYSAVGTLSERVYISGFTPAYKLYLN